jgi:hypothetical protein
LYLAHQRGIVGFTLAPARIKHFTEQLCSGQAYFPLVFLVENEDSMIFKNIIQRFRLMLAVNRGADIAVTIITVMIVVAYIIYFVSLPDVGFVLIK